MPQVPAQKKLPPGFKLFDPLPVLTGKDRQSIASRLPRAFDLFGSVAAAKRPEPVRR